MQYIQNMPQQGALFHRLTAQIAANYQGLGPGNVGANPYKGFTGLSFQKPLSGSTTSPTTILAKQYR